MGPSRKVKFRTWRGIPFPSLLPDLPSPGRHVSWQAAVAWLVAAVTLAGTGVKHLEGWPVARGARVSYPRRKSSAATTPCTTAVSHSSGCTIAGTISGGAILTRNRAGCTRTLVPASAGLDGRGRGHGRRWQWLGHSGSWSRGWGRGWGRGRGRGRGPGRAGAGAESCGQAGHGVHGGGDCGLAHGSHECEPASGRPGAEALHLLLVAKPHG